MAMYILTGKPRSGTISKKVETSVKNFKTIVLGLDLKNVTFPYYFIVPES